MLRSRCRVPAVLAALALSLGVLPAHAQDLASFEKRLTKHTLDNGLTLLVYERPEAPVVSFFTHVDVGSAQEVPGITGLAHMFEHMAFKGTTKIGTTDWRAEKQALGQLEAGVSRLRRRAAQARGGRPGEARRRSSRRSGRRRRRPTSSS